MSDEKELKELNEKMKQHMQLAEEEKNPVKTFTFECGCKIMGRGKSAMVDRILLCKRHQYMADNLRNVAPHTAKKILEWWEPDVKT